MSRVLIAFDVDGVLNCLSKNARHLGRGRAGRWDIQWRPSVLDRVRALVARDDVDPVWLTTWLMNPAELDELEELLELSHLGFTRAPHPFDDGDGVYSSESNMEPATDRWWKLDCAEWLLQRNPEHRFAWIDDDLGRAKGPRGRRWSPGVSRDRLLLAPDPVAGLLAAHMDKLEAWVESWT